MVRIKYNTKFSLKDKLFQMIMTTFNNKEQNHIILPKKTMNIKTKKRDKYAKTMMSNKME